VTSKVDQFTSFGYNFDHENSPRPALWPVVWPENRIDLVCAGTASTDRAYGSEAAT
jgi:hypothetical protein